MIVIKKDFVPEDTETYCDSGRKTLSSGKAYFMQKDDGSIVYGGKKCAEDNSNTDLSQIPDFTKSLLKRRDGAERNRRRIKGIIEQNDNSKSKAITYISLREEKLIDFMNGKLSYNVLHDYYLNYKKNNDLTQKEIQHILNIEKNEFPKKSLNNLLTCYAYKYILERTINYLQQNNNTEGINYINDLLNGEKGLKTFCNLTNEQIGGLQKWLNYLPRDLRESDLKKFGR
ncbi:MAG: hypothetical protein WC667_13265 [Sulfurimonas sp.]|jgi:hypothetical protein